MTKEKARELLEIYGRAWETKDPELVISIFTDNATYNDPKEVENFGRDAIKRYWETKVIGEQDNIHFRILNVWVDGSTVIAEWHATFTDIKRNLFVDLTEVAILEPENEKFCSLREYYKSIKTEL